MKAVLREPLVHFLIGGAVILALFGIVDETPPPAPENLLEISERDVDRLVSRFEATWRRPPSDEELLHLVDQLVRQEVLVREALALDLDQGDEIVRQRLVQKMTFLAEGSVAAVEATDDELQAHMIENPERFQRPATAAFAQYLLREGVEAADAVGVLAEDGDIESFVTPTLLPGRFPLTTQTIIDRTFGNGFFDALQVVEPGVWSGQITSAYGRHVVFVERVEPAGFPALADVRDAVELDWRTIRESELVEERIQALLSRYEVVLPQGLSGSDQ
ncbi:MAG: peptidylprolyl isomerase [Pseudomonadota bacterium]